MMVTYKENIYFNPAHPGYGLGVRASISSGLPLTLLTATRRDNAAARERIEGIFGLSSQGPKGQMNKGHLNGTNKRNVEQKSGSRCQTIFYI